MSEQKVYLDVSEAGAIALLQRGIEGPVAMLNLLGDLWPGPSESPDWQPLFEDGSATLHLYGKAKASSRRKMGHANFLGETVADAEGRALALKERWLAAGQG